jgi:hypothetical protein
MAKGTKVLRHPILILVMKAYFIGPPTSTEALPEDEPLPPD